MTEINASAEDYIVSKESSHVCRDDIKASENGG
jgi:hypothetical protein